MRTPANPASQLRGRDANYGVVRVSGNDNLVSNSSIFCDWITSVTDPVTIRSVSGTQNSYNNLKISNTASAKVFYVNETTEIANCVPATKVAVDGNPANVIIK